MDRVERRDFRDRMKRREFITLLGAAAAWPLAAGAQQSAKAHRIAVVNPARPVAMLTESGGLPIYAAFFKQLNQLGYVEGQNLLVERYSGEGRTESYAALARDVVGSKPEVIFVVSARMAQHFKATATTIPIVAYTTDPVATGLATSLARPGSNITGVVPNIAIEFWDKNLQFLRETVPTISRVAYLTPRELWDSPQAASIRKVARDFGMDLLGALLESPIGEPEYRRVFAAIVQDRANALLVNDAPENYANQRLITDLAMSTRLPASTFGWKKATSASHSSSASSMRTSPISPQAWSPAAVPSTVAPSAAHCATLRCVAGWAHISRFIAGATSSAQRSMGLARQSSASRSFARPWASCAMKSALAGATSTASASRVRLMCAMLLASRASH